MWHYTVHEENLDTLRGDKTDTLFSLFHMVVQTFPAIGMDINVAIVAIRDAANQVGVIFGVGPERIVAAIIKLPFRVVMVVDGHRGPVFQDIAVLFVSLEHIKYSSELGLKFRRVFVGNIFHPITEKHRMCLVQFPE